MDSQLLKGLNVAQKAAVTSQASVLQVLAPPGSGKTKTLTSRVAYLIAHHGLDPRNVICCTFTVKASREMRERLRELVGTDLESKLVMGTFHSICRRYLIAYGHLIGLPKQFGIADNTASKSIIKRVIKRLQLSLDYKKVKSKISSHKAKGESCEDLAKTKPKTKGNDHYDFVAAFKEYQSDLDKSQLLDYDDLLLRCVELLRAYPKCVSNIEALLIDEFQDTNVVQFELMRLLAWHKRRVTIVGDPDQSIYGFRAAEIENLNRMKTVYPETVVINLEENYRSTSSILMLAQDIIEQDKDRPQKCLKATHCHGTKPVLRRLPNPNEEALWIASEIKRTITMTGGLLHRSDIAILIRSAYLSLLIERALAKSGIPYRMVGGQRFFDRVEIRIIIDYLRTISHPDNDEAFLSIINVPSRKIGETTIAELAKVAKDRKISLWAVAQKAISGRISLQKNLSKPAEQELGRLVKLVMQARHKVETALPANVPSQLIDLVVKSIDFENYLKTKYAEDHEERLENLKELIVQSSDVTMIVNPEDQLATIDGLEQRLGNGGDEVLAQFLANIVLSSDPTESEEDRDMSRVTISTIHSAKGLEWPVVFLPALYEGSIPHSRAENTDEERRLLYVAVTRAQALLTMTFPLEQSRDRLESSLSSFLPTEIKRHLVEKGPLFDDATITDIARTLCRPIPSQEQLARSLATIDARDSVADDRWPVDGTHRPMPMAISENSAMPEPGLPLAEALARAREQRFDSHSSAKSWHDKKMTTMNDPQSFSTSTMTMGFTTARQHLNTVPPELSRTSSDPLPPTKKPKLVKSASGQGNIAAFFLKPGQACAQPSRSSPPRAKKFSPPPVREPLLPSAPPSFTRTTTVIPEKGIPEEFSSHRLHFRNGMVQSKPCPLSETSANATKRKGYGGLYSSSPPPPDFEETHKACEDKTVENKPSTFAQKPSPTNRTNAVAAPLTDYILSKPASTMHVTSMAALSRVGYSSTGSRKTLGVRRTMNGWENRKNK
ncbi:hypothetical protein PV10_02145 [Exophiala mesophila]|uniref:DNA 3'-5' helicase n=1 Tax=Exophiala mesophila TaxID=212818 RepID=A0A0D1ZIE4_EXOME|nr:uncharacterized protein PV10_02145 [Exophiala mesophila]KIV94372.1 hypothetical protein PV10_02145 [Exophiala mesophila]